MKVKTVKRCPECQEVVVLETAYQCGECEEVYEDRDEARECCKE